MNQYNPLRVRSLVLGEGRPKICVPLTASDLPSLREECRALQGIPFDLAEWRVDFLPADLLQDAAGNADVLRPFLQCIREAIQDRPLIFTCRTSFEGGNASVSLQQYADLLTAAAGSGLVDLTDVELKTAGSRVKEIVHALHDRGTPVIGSCHHFHHTPSNEEMIGTLISMQNAGMDVTKLAVMPASPGDVLRLMEISVRMAADLADRPFITMSMGRMGAVTRLAGSLTGSALTFAAVTNTSAPGQLPAELVDRLNHYCGCGD